MLSRSYSAIGNHARLLKHKSWISFIVNVGTTTSNDDQNVPVEEVKDAEDSDAFGGDYMGAMNDAGSLARVKRISRAMESYLESARVYESMLKKETEEFEIGKRHLANMMGWDTDNIGQADIDKAIEYLLPSSLTSKRARPIMKHPELIWPKSKSAAFDDTGRPFHYLFYTMRPNFYQLLSEAAVKAEESLQLEDDSFKKGIVEPDEKLNFIGNAWISKDELEFTTTEKITDSNYSQFISAMEYLISLPFCHIHKDFIMQHRKPVVTEDLTQVDLPEQAQVDADGRIYGEAVGTRKRCSCKVKVFANGSGKFSIDGEELEDFWTRTGRAELIHPFVLLNKLGHFDVEGKTWFNTPLNRSRINTQTFYNIPHSFRLGETARAGAVRLAISRALTVLVSPEEVVKLKVAGLLTRDIRRKERKYPNQKGARAKWRWKKR